MLCRRKGFGTALLEPDSLLTRDEVLAIRLYSGPAFQPINEFLREVAKLTAYFRERVSHDPGLTFCATVQHIINAIRKLAAVATEEESQTRLWRGVRGELPNNFWVRRDEALAHLDGSLSMSMSMSMSMCLCILRCTSRACTGGR